VLYCSV